MEEPVVRSVTCPNCNNAVNVRVLADAPKHTFHCPSCKKIVTAAA